jgi:hypothetical protein
MTYLNWGCDNLEDECESCLDALCAACQEDFKKKQRNKENPDGLEVMCQESDDPDCDHCDIEKKPDCSECKIILQVCRKCSGNATCEFKISG